MTAGKHASSLTAPKIVAETAGPVGDNGLACKKLVIYEHCARLPICGRAWSGKEFCKAGRSGGMRAQLRAGNLSELLDAFEKNKQRWSCAFSPNA